MAFGRKKKESGQEEMRRAVRYEDDDLLYNDDQDLYDRRPLKRRDAGYGVGDSYMRQEEYGRPSGWRPEEDSGYRGRRTDSGKDYRRETDGADYRRRTDQDTYARRERPEKWQSDPYDDRYQGSYDDFEDTLRRRPESGQARARKSSGQSYEAGRAARGADYRRQSGPPAGNGRERRRVKKKRGKGSFIAKIILLVIAALALFVVYRFTRMDRVRLGSLLMNEGADTGSGYDTFVIYGVDSREGQLTKDSHSDTIVICSIDKSAKQAKMVSVYRDTYLDNTNGEYRKATECYFFGGPERSINMLNKNLDLNIQNYIAVNFNAVIKAVDLIGGVDINVTEEELPYINGYQTENAAVTGAQITPVESAGYQHLNGIQALAYCRIRYTAGSDYKRTERQRDVLTQIFENAKKQGSSKMLQVADAMMPYISTSFSNAQIISLVGEMADLSIGDTTGFPFEQQPADIAAGDCVVPVNLAQNVRELHSFLFGQNDYTPSSAVQQISQQIVNDTGIG